MGRHLDGFDRAVRREGAGDHVVRDMHDRLAVMGVHVQFPATPTIRDSAVPALIAAG